MPEESDAAGRRKTRFDELKAALDAYLAERDMLASERKEIIRRFFARVDTENMDQIRDEIEKL